MKISIFGSGYVGLVTGACFAQMGNHITCVDIDADRVAQLSNGESPIFEPGLAPMLTENLAQNRIHFTTDAKQAVLSAEVIFIAVGTPPGEDGSADLQYVLQVAKTIGQHLDQYKVIVTKSTVPVGTADKVREAIGTETQVDFDVVSNPEFLKEGAAIADCMRPDRIVIGSQSARAVKTMQHLYAPFSRNHDKIIVMDERSAELTKYAANAMLATKISFMNEMSQIAERVGADVEQVRIGIGSDPRVGFQFIYPGCGYGGSCFPKDVRALDKIAADANYVPNILRSVHQVNEQQKQSLVKKIQDYYAGQLAGKCFALWGLAFKPNTDDVREAPSLVVIDALLQAGATVQAYDPEAAQHVRAHFADRTGLHVADNPDACLQGANALVVCTEWQLFRSPDFVSIKKLLADAVIFDGRNLYDPEYLAEIGLHYIAMGRSNLQQGEAK